MITFITVYKHADLKKATNLELQALLCVLLHKQDYKSAASVREEMNKRNLKFVPFEDENI